MRVFILLFYSIYIVNVLSQNIATIKGNNVAINNNAIIAYIEGGRMTVLNLPNQPNLLNNGGFGYFNYVDNIGNFSPTSLTPQIKINTENIADIYFQKIDNFNVEMHYVFRKNESGFFVYYVISDVGITGNSMNSVRFAVRVDKTIFNYAWNIEREGEMISPKKLDNYIKEIQDATYLLQDSTIYTKYDWAVPKIYDFLHGLMGNGYGLWNIEASHEYNNGGPTMQELTVHGTNTTPIVLSQFFSNHYGCETILLRDEYSRWTKVFGPHFIYINTGNNETILNNAKQKANAIKAEWPFEWLINNNYPLERGLLTGQLNIIGNAIADSAMVVLCKSGPSWLGEQDHWQKQPYDYQYYGEADSAGNFSITDIRPGNYTLYAYTQKGKLIDELKKKDIVVNVGANSIGTINWNANDKQKTIFQIGIADHKSGEYKLANLPRLYGRWKECPLTLAYDVQLDNSLDNWYYCQRVNSNWEIKFNINNLSSIQNPVLKVAIAGSDANPHLSFILNGNTISSNDLGSDSGIRRSSLTGGKYTLLTCNINKNLLVNGINSLVLKCYGSANEYKGVMYDAILLESDTVENNTDIKPIIISDNENISISHIPFSGNLNVKSNMPISAMRIIDLFGKTLFFKKTDLEESYSINKFYNPSGIYILQLYTAENVYNKKFIYN